MAAAKRSDTKRDNQDRKLESTLIKTVLNLEEIDTDLYRGTHLWKPVGGRAVFGGQVVGQALVAAGKSKSPNMHVHSLHSYFVRSGQPDRPILYHVERTRNGRSFSTRSVTAMQNGEAILTMMVSYHKIEPSPIKFQYIMPKVPPPDELESVDEFLRKSLRNDVIPQKYKGYIKKVLAEEITIDMRPVDPFAFYRHTEPKLQVWVRANGYIGDTANNMHRCVAAYLSDMTLIRTALIPWPRFEVKMAASLDHAMWFHNLFRADEWMLYECESPRTIGARSLIFGRLWRRDGTLAISVAQEGVIRGTMSDAKL